MPQPTVLGAVGPQEWADAFHSRAESAVRDADRGTLHSLVLEHDDGSVRAVARFTMDQRPGVIFEHQWTASTPRHKPPQVLRQGSSVLG
ncbi:hypothetical protein GCM10010121_088100 [Streptomyces brasiliensis]|uniref:Uncharacterized protein n=1 Tax=Streptomyces brasiliensis TaxID=1954 RepID=A0A917P695_9ACTN|nr:hypothetical protein GCM10010121_088100 [Streptomyces brasiliensis]